MSLTLKETILKLQDTLPEILTAHQLVKTGLISQATIDKMKKANKGIPYLKIGAWCKYHKADFLNWLRQQSGGSSLAYDGATDTSLRQPVLPNMKQAIDEHNQRKKADFLLKVSILRSQLKDLCSVYCLVKSGLVTRSQVDHAITKKILPIEFKVGSTGKYNIFNSDIACEWIKTQFKLES